MKRTQRLKCLLVMLGLLLFLSSCSLPGLPTQMKPNTLSIGSTGTSESRILAGMVKAMVEHYTDLQVNMLTNLGSSRIMHQAMLRGEVSISASRYTGSDLTGTLNLPAESDPTRALQLVQEGFLREFDLKWYPSYGFDNTYAFVVSKEVAEKYNLEKVSDLGNYASELRIGIDTVWLKRKGDGYDGFKKTYGIDFNNIYPMQIGLVYNALAVGKMDVALGYSSDGRITSYDLVMLEDDLSFFPAYDCSIVVSMKLLQEHPDLDRVFLKLVDKIDTATMQQLNFEVDDNLIEPELVARRFLQEHNYFAD